MAQDLLEGQLFLIDKPYGWTSFDVVNKMRMFIKFQWGIPKIKIGHAGTLDPLATGLLIICTGKYTKKIDSYQDQEKEYTGSFFIGQTTPSYDLEKEPDTDYPTEHITSTLLLQAAAKLTGAQLQLPPVFSAVKVDGKRLYLYARKNQEVIIIPREITIKEFELTRIALPLVDFRVVCSKGTYIRSLARDFGNAIGSGAYLHTLCRTRIGNYSLSDACTLPEWEKSQKNISLGLLD